LGGLAVAAAVVVALGAGLGGPVSHAGRFAERLRQGPPDAAGVVVDQLARNLRLLANSPFAWVGPLQVLLAGLIALRPPRPFDRLPVWIRRVPALRRPASPLSPPAPPPFPAPPPRRALAEPAAAARPAPSPARGPPRRGASLTGQSLGRAS